MAVTPVSQLTLEAFLQQPNLEESPPWEYFNGQALQKPMPQGRHAIIQSELVTAINQVAKAAKVAYAFPERRCSFGGRSIVPDIAVIYWARVPLSSTGEIADEFNEAPDWAIEILSPDQSANRVTANLLHGLKHGGKLGWLIDPDDRSILVLRPSQEPQIYAQTDRPLVLPNLNFNLTVEAIFDWLKFS